MKAKITATYPDYTTTGQMSFEQKTEHYLRNALNVLSIMECLVDDPAKMHCLQSSLRLLEDYGKDTALGKMQWLRVSLMIAINEELVEAYGTPQAESLWDQLVKSIKDYLRCVGCPIEERN